MLRAMYRSSFCDSNIPTRFSPLPNSGTNDIDALEILRQRFNAQHYSLRKFYYECSNLKYLTGLINVPKLGQVVMSPRHSITLQVNCHW
jgi:hypothetical protein